MDKVKPRNSTCVTILSVLPDRFKVDSKANKVPQGESETIACVNTELPVPMATEYGSMNSPPTRKISYECLYHAGNVTSKVRRHKIKLDCIWEIYCPVPPRKYFPDTSLLIRQVQMIPVRTKLLASPREASDFERGHDWTNAFSLSVR